MNLFRVYKCFAIDTMDNFLEMWERDLEQKGKIPIRLLCVEDEAVIREELKRLLKRIVKEVITAENGKLGLLAYKEYAPDMIVTDIKMPQMTGLEMSKEIRKENSDIPIIITTAHSETEFLLEAIKIHVTDFLLKPIDTEDLIKAVEKKGRDILLEKELIKQRRRFETIINFQDNIIILADGKGDIVDANKSFFDFFGVSSLLEFKSVHKSLDSKFIKENGIISQAEDENWIKNLLEGKFEKNIAKIEDKTKSVRTFLVKATKFPEEEELYIISMSDVTDMEREAEILERLATTDPLTKIYNRLKLNELLSFEIKKVSRYEIPLSLVMLDIDHFKNINDKYGHDVGDFVLVKLCETILAEIRDSDVFARWGGEEFMIMLPNTNLNGAMSVAEHLRAVIEETDFGIAGRVTASFGVAEYSKGKSIDEFLKSVDDALYEAKRAGRNRVIAANRL